MHNYEFPSFLFHEGKNFESWRFLGSHFQNRDDENGVLFRVWAPNAKNISIIGDFNYWDRNTAWEMNKISNKGIWELFIPNLEEYMNYKYLVTGADGKCREKSDPFAFLSETKGSTASKLYDIHKHFDWNDYEFRKNKKVGFDDPINIYEVNLGSWRKYADGNFFDYRKLADELYHYVIEMNYTHVELMPITEYPFDGSWGYQVTGYFSATSRYGKPDDLMYFVDKMHSVGVGVLVDWVPAHFPKDSHGLIEFDGSYQYETADPYVMEHKNWGTRTFDYAKPEIQSFLISSAMFWLDVFHFDGIRVDAVASMLYLDYDRSEWRPNEHGSNINLAVVAFFQKLNASIFEKHPAVLMIAEESTAFPKVTKPTTLGGLGFNYKWNMGWMNDILRYMNADPYHRQFKHDLLTNTFLFAFSENYILPISHDEVVHGKGSLLSKMPGNYDEKFGNLRAFMSFMMVYPGKKLIFMGSELGQFNEWADSKELDWELLNFEKHRQTKLFFSELNKLYINTPEFYERDCDSDGFKMIVHDDKQQNIIAFIRSGHKGGQVIIVCNFSTVARYDYKIGAPDGKYIQIFNSDNLKYGGWGVSGDLELKAVKGSNHGFANNLSLTVPPLGAIYLKRV